eukprot:gene8080-12541_t
MSLQLSLPHGKKTKSAPRTKSGKRRQVRQACQHCRKSHTACEEQRPCRRCVAHGLADSCIDVHAAPKTSTNFPQKRSYEQMEKVQLPSKKVAQYQAPPVLPNTYQPIAMAPKLKDSMLNLFSGEEEIFPSLDFFSNVDVKEYNPEELLNFDFEPSYDTTDSDQFFDQNFLTSLTNDITKTNTKPENEVTASWNLDGTILTANESFMNLFKIPEQLITYSTIGPHFSTIIQNEQSKKIFQSVLKNQLKNYIGVLELKEFNTEFEIDSFFNQNFRCEVNLKIVYDEEDITKAKRVDATFSPL